MKMTLIEIINNHNAYLPKLSSAGIREIIALRNLMAIAQRNNWPHSLAQQIFPSNR